MAPRPFHTRSDYDDEPGDWEDWDDGSGWMASLTPLRNDLLDGDWRCLYLAWLAGIETESLPDKATEPPVPAGLKDLSAPLGAFVDFLEIDAELVNVAAARSSLRVASDPPAGALKKWVHSLTVAEKESLLLRIAQGDEPNPRRSLMRSFKETAQGHHTTLNDEDTTACRTVAEISEAWQQRVRERQRRIAEQAEKEREHQARAEAQARKERLEDIASRAPVVWKQVSTWIAKRTPKGYDRAVELLVDLRDAAAHANRTDDFSERLQALRNRHASKPSLVRRLQQSGLA